MYILGLVEGHNCSAALLKNGKIIAACFEERLSRLKNDLGYPEQAIDYCLTAAGITPDEIDYVAMVTENLPFGQVAVKREATFGVEDHLKEQEHYWKPVLLEGRQVDYIDLFKDKLQIDSLAYDFPSKYMDRSSFQEFSSIRKNTIKRKLNKKDDQIHCLNHHYAHSMYAIFTTPTCHSKEMLVMVSDGYGDDCSASVGTWKNGKFCFVSKSTGSGIGRIYRYATLLLGMRPGIDEFKVMGLAPYAKKYHWEKMRDSMKRYLRVDGMEISYTNPDKDIYFSLKNRLKSGRFDGIAAGVQKFCEDISKDWFKNAIKQTGIRDIVYSGGVAMNIKINKIIMEIDEVRDIFVGPSGGDESLSLGAAYGLWHMLFPDKPISPLEHTYLGPSFSKADSEEAITSFDLNNQFIIIEDPSVSQIVELLVEGKVIARSVGRMEYGARALGNRSILARADDPGIIRKINDSIKRRDFWMPFAPVILKERMHDYLLNPKEVSSPYMTMGFDSTEMACKHLRAALHPADDTMRPQLLERHHNPRLYELIKAFEVKTGIGGMLNTSFNLHGEPICCSPTESIKTFLNSELDCLLLEGFLILRSRL